MRKEGKYKTLLREGCQKSVDFEAKIETTLRNKQAETNLGKVLECILVALKSGAFLGI